MKNFLVCRHFSFVLILSSILVSPSLGNKRLGVGFNEPERTIFRDDYGTSLTDSDCPTRVDENPKFTFSNETHSYPSYYFSLYCVARYPVAVEFDGAKALLSTVRFLVANANPENMTNACYVIQISQQLYRDSVSPVGNFTCRSIHDPTKSSSKYIFAQSSWGWRYQGSFNIRKDQVVYVNENSVTSFVIPCIANKPTVKDTILKKEETGTADERRVESFAGFKVKYDPYQGFIVNYTKPSPPLILSSTTLRSDASDPHATSTTTHKSLVLSPRMTSVTGKYVCVDVNSLTTEDVTVKHADFLVFPNQTNITFDTGSTTFECYANTPVSLRVLEPSSKLDRIDKVINSKFALLGFTHGAKATFSTKDLKAIGRIGCVETSTAKHLHEWTFDNGFLCKCEWNNTFNDRYNRRYYYPYSQEEPEFGESPDSSEHNRYNMDWDYFDPPYFYSDITCYNEKATSVDFTIHHCQNPTECAFFRQSCDKDPQNCATFASDYYHRYPFITTKISNRTSQATSFMPGIILCNADGYLSNINISTDWKGGMYFNDDSHKSDVETMHLRSSESHVFTGDRMLYSCLGTSSDVVNPIIWGFKYDDGSFNYSYYAFDNYQWDDRLMLNQRIVSTMRATYLTIPERNGSQLYCFAPKWDSKTWAQASIKLTIEDADVAENPPQCPTKSNPFIVMYRNSSSLSRTRVRLPHRVDGRDALVFDPVDSVSLYCMAKFPVIWFKDGVNVTAARVSRANCKRSDGIVSVRYLYKSTVSFKISDFNATGNYTCQSISPHKSRQTSTYIYAMSPSNRTTFVDEGKHHIIRYQWTNHSDDWNTKKWVVLPCRLNTPDIRPFLFLDIPEEERIEKVPINKMYLRFNPKVGFSIDVTYRKVIRGNKTIFFCSDHEDGSFIGTMITLELVYENPNPPQNMTLTTTQSPAMPTTHSPTTPTTPPTTHDPHHVSAASTDNSSQNNSGFIVVTVLLSAVCVGCVGVIFFLYKKVQMQTSKTFPTSSQELDWTRALQHNASHPPPPPTANGNGVIIGNGIHSSSSTIMNPSFIETPNILESLDSNSLIANEQVNNDNECLVDIGGGYADQDRSLSSLSDNDFGYKKL
ncbi:uncharacterized protein LOC110847566 [Folsomia candida]|uniref:uncharacterized protein LOC110847566 n=1 Tax=Folsomia candida TaxID=158441 RepID=UPI001604ECD8|nr:uncharacterized protein LOC110847566 [Folsomia candida]XP_035705727.1 uncharacterized protein LOC110847566 [Folsomia candida]